MESPAQTAITDQPIARIGAIEPPQVSGERTFVGDIDVSYLVTHGLATAFEHGADRAPSADSLHTSETGERTSRKVLIDRVGTLVTGAVAGIRAESGNSAVAKGAALMEQIARQHPQVLEMAMRYPGALVHGTPRYNKKLYRGKA